jgi:hypothetical protein
MGTSVLEERTASILLFVPEDRGSPFLRNIGELYRTRQRHTPEAVLSLMEMSLLFAQISSVSWNQTLREKWGGNMGAGPKNMYRKLLIDMAVP